MTAAGSRRLGLSLFVLALARGSTPIGDSDVSQPATATPYRIVPHLSRASYAVDEVFLRENNRLFTAVGVTSGISGEISIDRVNPARSRLGDIVVDVKLLTSDSERRDRALRDAYLESNRFPAARLSAATLHDMPTTIADGRPFRFSIVGTLTVRDVSRRTRWLGEATLVGDTLRGRAATQVKMSEFGIAPPSLLALRSADTVKLDLQLVAVSRHPPRVDRPADH
jgi:polyisoprenoid-binding protein YceI